MMTQRMGSLYPVEEMQLMHHHSLAGASDRAFGSRALTLTHTRVGCYSQSVMPPCERTGCVCSCAQQDRWAIPDD